MVSSMVKLISSKRAACLGIICTLLLFSLTGSSLASDSIRIFINGTELVYDVPLEYNNGRLLVPVRALGEGLGCEVIWDDANQSAILQKGDIVIAMTAGSVWASINEDLIELEAPMQITNGHCLAPARFVGEALGYAVSWKEDAQEVRYDDNPSSPLLDPGKVEYVTYCNLNSASTPYVIDYPSSFIRDIEDPGEISFTSPDGQANLTVWDLHSQGYANISECYAAERSLHKDSIIYEILRSEDKWYVLAWDDGNDVVYSKTFFTGSSIVRSHFSYPQADEKYYETVIDHCLQSFALGNTGAIEGGY